MKDMSKNELTFIFNRRKRVMGNKYPITGKSSIIITGLFLIN